MAFRDLEKDKHSTTQKWQNIWATQQIHRSVKSIKTPHEMDGDKRTGKWKRISDCARLHKSAVVAPDICSNKCVAGKQAVDF